MGHFGRLDKINPVVTPKSRPFREALERRRVVAHGVSSESPMIIHDVSIQMVWQLEGFGIGNLARVKAQRGEQSRTIIDLRRTQDTVAADVNRALARVQLAAARVRQADRSLRTGIITFNGQLAGLGQNRRFGDTLVLINRPQEAVDSLKLLNIAFEESISTVSEYDRAQFELFHALGDPAREIAELRTPGEVAPLDTSRPSYLPRVGNGPPAATH